MTFRRHTSAGRSYRRSLGHTGRSAPWSATPRAAPLGWSATAGRGRTTPGLLQLADSSRADWTMVGSPGAGDCPVVPDRRTLPARGNGPRPSAGTRIRSCSVTRSGPTVGTAA